MRVKLFSQVACGLVFLLGAAGMANAGSFAVNPVRVTLSAEQKVSALTIHNNGGQPAVVQLQVVEWSQQNGKDVYVPTRDLLATPPIMTVPPGQSQVIRVGLRATADPRVESAYRLFLREVPPPSPDGQGGLQVALHLSLPIFVKPAVAAAPELRWEAESAGDGQLRVRLANSGNAHVQVTGFRIGLEGAELETKPVSGYLLPGQQRDWLVKLDAEPGQSVRLHAATDAGDSQANLVAR